MDEPIMAYENKKIDRLAQAVSVLEDNDYGYYTVPSTVLYPHQWLWDSCFISIGQRHFDVDRAQTELLSLLRGQWSNGMLPNIISVSYTHLRAHETGRNLVCRLLLE